MKTARQWFQCLRPDLREKAIKYTKTQNYKPRGKFSLFSKALIWSFFWNKTPEGDNFWSKIYWEARDIERGFKPDIKPKKLINKTKTKIKQ